MSISLCLFNAVFRAVSSQPFAPVFEVFPSSLYIAGRAVLRVARSDCQAGKDGGCSEVGAKRGMKAAIQRRVENEGGRERRASMGGRTLARAIERKRGGWG